MLIRNSALTLLVLIALACGASPAWAGTIGGTIVGLSGSGLVLQNNERDDLAVSSNGSFVFPTILPDGVKYDVTVLAQPRGPVQTCVVTNGGGVVRGDITSIAVICTNGSVARFLYTPSNDGTVSTYAVDAKTGQLHAAGYVDTGFGDADAMTVEPSNRFAYVVQARNNSVAAFRIDPASGALIPVSAEPPVSTGGEFPIALTVHSNGRFLYVVNGGTNNISVFNIDDTTGALTPVKNAIVSTGGDFPSLLVMHPSLPFLYVLNDFSKTLATFTIDPIAGTLKRTALTALDGAVIRDLKIDPAGRFFYVADFGRQAVGAFRIETTGALTKVSGSPFAVPSFPVSLGVDPIGSTLYVGASNTVNELVPNGVFAYAIDGTSGALTSIPGRQIDTPHSVTSLTVAPSGDRIFLSHALGIVSLPNSEHGVSTIAIDPKTGALSLAGRPVRGRSTISITTANGARPVVFKPKFVYVADANRGTVTGFRVDAQTGSLSIMQPVSVGNVKSIAADPSGRFLYVANAGTEVGASGSVVSLRIDAASGALTPERTLQTGSQLSAIAIDPGSQFAYVADRSDNTITRFSLDAASGTLSAPLATPSAGDPTALAIDPAGLVAYGVNASTDRLAAYDVAYRLFRLDTQIGQLFLFPDAGRNPYLTGANPSGVAVDPTGHFVYAANGSSDTISAFALAPRNNALTPIPGSPYSSMGSAPSAVATEPSGRFVYVANKATNTIGAYTIEPVTGALTPVPGSPFAAGSQPVAMSTDTSGALLYVANASSSDVSVYAIDSVTGVPAPVPGSPFPTGGTMPVSLAVVGATE